MTYPKSDHYDGKRFHNKVVSPHGTMDALRWLATRKKGPWRTEHVDTRRSLPALGPDGFAVTFVGHSTTVVQVGGRVLVTDPLWSERCSPVGFAGPKRFRPPGVALDGLPNVDLVLLSHDHYDHLDVPSLRRIRERWPESKIVTSLGVDHVLRRNGIGESDALDWWQTCEPLPDVRVTVCPARHFSGRSLSDRDSTLWCSLYVEVGGKRVYYAGDTGYSAHFNQVRSRLGAPDLALLPIGAFRPEWFMGPVHVTPEEALQAHEDLGAKLSLGVHYGSFALADDGMDEPLERLSSALAESPTEEPFITLDHGETRLIESTLVD